MSNADGFRSGTETTPAAELRQAARVMREWALPSWTLAVADWLEDAAEHAAIIEASGAAAQHPHYCHHELRVARAYLGTGEGQ